MQKKKKTLDREPGAQFVLFDEKNRRSKISWHCPFKETTLQQAVYGFADFKTQKSKAFSTLFH
jgi:hypothetical protein